MAILSSRQNGNFTDAATWGVVDPVSFSASEVAATAVAASFASSASFTPGAITIDGIGVRILQAATAAVGTFTVQLAQGVTPVAGTTVTVNVADLPTGTNSMVGWVFFKFAAPVTLLAATSYNVRVVCSASGQVSVFRSGVGSDWSRFLRTTTTAAPAATDLLIVNGEYTAPATSAPIAVTMNNTAIIDFASCNVGNLGTLAYTTAPATNSVLRLAGDLFVTGNGVFTMGTLALPIPANSLASLRFLNTTNADFGVQIRGYATFTTYGRVVTGRARLAANAGIGATSITTDVATGWLANDDVVLASTSISAGDTEARILSANASGTTVTLPALTFAHSGTAPTQGEIINLTRNVQIIGTSVTLQTYFTNIQGSFSTISCNYTVFRFLGSGTTNRRGIELSTLSPGSAAFIGCAFSNFAATSSFGISIGAGSIAQNVTVDDCVFFRINTQAIAFSASAASSCVVTNCWAFTNIAAGNALFTYSSPLPTFTGIVAVSATGSGFSISTNDIVTSGLLANLTAHSNAANGISLTANSQMSTPPVISNLVVWRNNLNLLIVACQNIVVDTLTAFSASSTNVSFTTTASVDFQIRNAAINAGATPAAFDGIRFATSCDRISVVNSSLGTLTTHPSGDVNSTITRGFLGANFYNCLFGSANEVVGLGIASFNSYVASSRHDGVLGEFRTFTPIGRITKDVVIFDAGSPGLNDSVRMAPTSTAAKLSFDKVIAVPAGRRLRLQVGVRRSVAGDGAAYNGALPQLVVKKNYALGLTTDTILATAGAASLGAFEFITGLTPIATDDGAFTVCVTCDGTAGWINVDSWLVEIV